MKSDIVKKIVVGILTALLIFLIVSLLLSKYNRGGSIRYPLRTVTQLRRSVKAHEVGEYTGYYSRA